MAATAPLMPLDRARRQHWLNCWLLIALAALLGGAALQALRIAQEYSSQRTNCLVAGIAGGIGLAFTLGGAMHYIDLLLDHDSARRPPWYLRILLTLKKRLLFFAQLAGTALLLACLAAILFDLTIPGPDYSMLYRGGYVPPVPEWTH